MVQHCFEYINKYFPTESLILFGIDDFSNNTDLKAVAYYGMDKKEVEKYTFNRTNLEEKNIPITVTNKNDEGIYLQDMLYYEGNSHPELFNNESDIIRVYKTISPKIIFAIWIRYNSWNLYKNEEEEDSKIYLNAMMDFYNYIAATNSAILGNELEDNLSNTIRVFGHEVGQILPRLRHTIEYNFEDLEKLKYLIKTRTVAEQTKNKGNGKGQHNLKFEELKISQKTNDMKNHIELLVDLGQRASWLFKNIEKEDAEFDIYKSVFYKLQNLYSTETEHKDIQIEVLKGIHDRMVVSDKKLVEHVVYNLIDNAIKYCYRGTKIEMGCRESNENWVITVTSYGPEIEEGREIYKLFKRGKNTEGNKETEGLGIGMFLVEKIVKGLGGEIGHTSTMISRFHIPCLYRLEKKYDAYSLYLIRFFDKKEIFDEISSLKIKGIFNSVLALSQEEIPFFLPEENTVISNISKATYKNIFTVKI